MLPSDMRKYRYTLGCTATYWGGVGHIGALWVPPQVVRRGMGQKGVVFLTGLVRATEDAIQLTL